MTRRAFTLVEILAVVAILGALVLLLLPAVQKVRAAASLLSCQNNLKQIGLAAQTHDAAYGELPKGVTPHGVTREAYPAMNWLTQLLPYLDQEPLWNKSVAAYQKEPLRPWWHPHEAMMTPVKTFSCPLDDRLVRPHLVDSGAGVYAALTSYLGVSGTNYTSADGVYYYGSRTNLTDIVDGTSNTLAAGERPPNRGYWFGWWYASGYGSRNGGQAVLGVRELHVEGDAGALAGCPQGPYHFEAGSIDQKCDGFHYWSLHPGGSNFALADGSVRFLRYEVDAILPALATRSGGEVAALD